MQRGSRGAALHDATLDADRGEYVVPLGAAGSGKSTLLNILGGLDRPSAGALRCAGQMLSGATVAELTDYRRQHVGFVFQFYSLIPSLIVRENVALVSEIVFDELMDALPAIAGNRGKPCRWRCDWRSWRQLQGCVAATTLDLLLLVPRISSQSPAAGSWADIAS